MKSLQDIFEIMLKDKDLGLGICMSLLFIDVSEQEHNLMSFYLRENLPEPRYKIKGFDNPFYSFPLGDRESRVKWIERQIELLNAKEQIDKL